MSDDLQAPFPYFGGKSDIADEVWRRFGNVPGYVEPFCGSAAVLLRRPAWHQPWGVETINDMDGMIANFWRSVQVDPKAVAHYADWPANQNDLHARHKWLVARKDSLREHLESDPGWHDAQVAGWWVWGMCLWIGSGWCAGGNSRNLVHLGPGQGVHRKRVHLSNAGRGDDQCEASTEALVAWMRALCDRLRRVRVCCGDWTRVCGGQTGDALSHFLCGGEPCGVFLDPPYSSEANRDNKVYVHEDLTVAHDVREWAIAHGDDTRLRIALCGYEGEHAMPSTWTKFAWKAQGGMARLGADAASQGKVNRHHERVWFSPHCRTPDQTLFEVNDAPAL